MIKRLISACIVVTLASCICSCAQTAEDVLVAEVETEEQEDTVAEGTEPESEETDVGTVAYIKDITWEQIEYNVVNLLKNADWGIWNMWWVAAETMEGYSSPIYKLEDYYKEHGVVYVKETLYIGYRDGKWELVPGIIST